MVRAATGTTSTSWIGTCPPACLPPLKRLIVRRGNWCSGTPAPIRANLACLDYSAVLYGKLVAYRLDQETRLDPHKFVWVEVERPAAMQ